MTLTGYNDIVNGYNSVIADGELPDANTVKAVVPPIGTIMAWLKTFAEADSGTTTSTSANHLVQTGQNFQTTISVGMVVKNTTDSTYSYVTAVNSDTDLTLNDDIIISGEDYVIYKVPYLPDAWAECNGQVLSDASSPLNGVTMPNLNGNANILYGATSSGSTKSEDYVAPHTHEEGTLKFYVSNATSYTRADGYGGAAAFTGSIDGSTASTESGTALAAYSVVWIVRVK